MDDRLRDLVSRATAFDGNPPFSDGALVGLVNGKRELVWIEEAAALVSPTEAEFVVEPDARRRGLGTRMLEQLIHQSRGELLFWAHGDHPAARALARSHGLEPVRELLNLRAPVAPPRPDLPPPDLPPPDLPKRRSFDADNPARSPNPAPAGQNSVISEGGTGVRGFTPRDEDAWLALNARAFAGHPEQGRVTRADLDAIMTEPWFDAADFLLLWEGDELVGYSWMKLEGELGEFYVIGVSPERQGDGLSRRLVKAGMAHLAERGIPQAHLYVEADNAPALRLYRSFGFREHSIDIQYRRRTN